MRFTHRFQALLLCIGFASIAAGCGGGTIATKSCGFPPPVPIPAMFLSYPEPNATNVPVNVGIVIFGGVTSGFYGSNTVTVAGPSGDVPVGAFTSAPSPLPSPHAVPSGWGGAIPYVAVSIPTLSPRATYNVSFTYIDWANNPPSCKTNVTQPLGSFTTQ